MTVRKIVNNLNCDVELCKKKCFYFDSCEFVSMCKLWNETKWIVATYRYVGTYLLIMECRNEVRVRLVKQ